MHCFPCGLWAGQRGTQPMPQGMVRGAHPCRLSLPCQNSRALQGAAYTQGLIWPSNPRCPRRCSLKPGKAWAIMESGELEGSRTEAWVWAGAPRCLSLSLYPHGHSLGYEPLHRAMIFKKKKKSLKTLRISAGRRHHRERYSTSHTGCSGKISRWKVED